MNTVYDGQSLQSYGLRLQTSARRPLPRDVARSTGLRPRLRALVARRSA
ncbi:MAG: hypothetical protein JWN17_1497 [Frankiales bacterium]|nr:hypothetical protein [Frankiales bacterium]